MATTEQPGLDEIEQCFIAVLDGSMSRDEADRWAARWVADGRENAVPIPFWDEMPLG
uniref:hypothetical protein n=1 Tax=Herbidospora sakaeratensis TaxID=564415 RepID=UPI000AA446BA|nr:hypothetical protein [Herbidospora sakaeratensis]